MEELKMILPILQVLSQGGLAIIIFVIWYVTFKKADSTSKEAFRKHEELSATLIQLLKDEQEYKLQLSGILDRMSVKLDTPAQCPILMSGKKIKFEVTED